MKGHKQCLIILLKHTKKPEYKLDKALKHAVRKKQSDTVETLLDYILDKLESKKFDHLVPIMKRAVVNVDKETIDVFLKKGFSINGGKFIKVTFDQEGGWFKSLSYRN